MPESQLNWLRCQGDIWCNLSTVNLGHSHFNNMVGVYIIWHGGTTPATVYVGQGNIREQLTTHRINPLIQRFAGFGLYVTWASVTGANLTGVVRYLEDRLTPIVRDPHPTAIPIPVNLPW